MSKTRPRGHERSVKGLTANLPNEREFKHQEFVFANPGFRYTPCRSYFIRPFGFEAGII